MRPFARPALASLVLAIVAAFGAAHAQTAVSGLGQSSPNTTDVSASPNYHVYVFQRGNTRYFQINDANGKVRAAVARTPYALVGTPIGSDAENVATPDEPLPAAPSTASETVYEDATTTIVVAPQANGTLRVMAVPVDCKAHPEECTSRGP